MDDFDSIFPPKEVPSRARPPSVGSTVTEEAVRAEVLSYLRAQILAAFLGGRDEDAAALRTALRVIVGGT